MKLGQTILLIGGHVLKMHLQKSVYLMGISYKGLSFHEMWTRLNYLVEKQNVGKDGFWKMFTP